LSERFSTFEEFKKWAFKEEFSVPLEDRFKVYAYQMEIHEGDCYNNLQKVKNILNKIDSNSLLLLPELFSSGFPKDRNTLILCSEETEKFIENVIIPISKRKRLTVVGTYPRHDYLEAKFFNTAFIVDNGVRTNYRDKYYLFKLTEEDKLFERGNKDFSVKGTTKGKIGVMICYELRFPDIANAFFKNKIDILLIPAEWGKKRKEHLKCLSKARAIEQRAFCVVANASGLVGDVEMAGASAIYSPWGEELAYIDEGEGLISAEIDLKEVKKIERYFKGRN